MGSAPRSVTLVGALAVGLLLGSGGVGCARARGPTLHDAAALLRQGDATRALAAFSRLAEAADAEKGGRARGASGAPDPALRVEASLGAARSAAALGDRDGERRWLERAAADPEVPGASYQAYFALAEVLRAHGERSVALGYYYRAAAGASRQRDLEYLYRRSVEAIAAMGLTP